MSIIYCEKHDKRWDSDFLDECPLCENRGEVDSGELMRVKMAVARGWCSLKNQHKEMDTDLALAIVDEIMALRPLKKLELLDELEKAADTFRDFKAQDNATGQINNQSVKRITGDQHG